MLLFFSSSLANFGASVVHEALVRQLMLSLPFLTSISPYFPCSRLLVMLLFTLVKYGASFVLRALVREISNCPSYKLSFPLLFPVQSYWMCHLSRPLIEVVPVSPVRSFFHYKFSRNKCSVSKTIHSKDILGSPFSAPSSVPSPPRPTDSYNLKLLKPVINVAAGRAVAGAARKEEKERVRTCDSSDYSIVIILVIFLPHQVISCHIMLK